MHQNLTAGDVAERKEGVDRDILEALQTMTGHVQHSDLPISSAVAGPHVVGVSPIGYVIQIVIAKAPIVRLVLP